MTAGTRGQGDEGQHQGPIGAVLAAELHDAQRPGELGIVVDHHQRQQEIVPALHQGEDADGGQDRPRSGRVKCQKKRI